MDTSELLAAGIVRQAELIATGEVASRELTEACLERIERLDPQLNAFRVVLAERAREGADAADRRRAAGERLPLLGVPVAVNDNVDVAGELTTHGTLGFTKLAEADSEHARRLREAGAVLVGKTTLPELAICGFTETDAWGITRNPWDLQRSTGGSSGGSGAAVAAGMVGAASASDGGGSIRIPAANCGLFGLKPQRGRVSMLPDPEHWHGLSVAGCLTRRVADTALWLDVTAGQAEGDVHRPPAPAGPYLDAARSDPGRLRVAFSTKPARAGAPPVLDERVIAALEGTVEVLRSLGHDVHERAPDYGGVGNDFVPRFLAGIAADFDSVQHPERLEPRTRGFARMGHAIPRSVLRRAMAAEAKHAARINRTFDDADVLLTPVTGEPSVEVGRWAGQGAFRTLIGMGRTYPFTPVWNYTGQPAASVPAPVAEGELPIGAMLIAPPNREDLLLSLSAQLEAETSWPERMPEIAR